MQIKFFATLFLSFFCTFVLVSQPSNDTWSTPQDVLLSTDGNCGNAVMGTTLGANETQYLGTCYGANLTSDVWYRFVATSTTVRILIEGLTLQDPGIQVMYGDSTKAYFVLCEDHQKGNTEEAIPSGLEIGAPYFIRVFSSLGMAGAGTFSLCVRPPQPPPVNDLCNNAVELIPSSDLNCPNSVQGSTLGATGGIYSGSSCNYGYDDDVWYYFTATAAKHVISVDYTTTNGSYDEDPLIEVFSGDCNALQNVGCFYKSASLEGLTIGKLYRVRIYTYNYSLFINFTVCLRTPGQPPANDECNGAIFLPVNGVDCTNDVNASTANATFNYASCSGGYSDDLVWFAFVATAPTHIISLSDIVPISSFDQDSISMSALAGNCSNFNTLNCNFYTSNTMAVFNLTLGDTIYLTLATFGNKTYLSFNICVTTPAPGPVNDVCSGAIELIPSASEQCTNPVDGTTVNAYNSYAPIYNIGGPENEVWYKFTAIAPVQEVLLQNLTFVQPAIELYSVNNCQNFTRLNPYPYGGIVLTDNKVRYDGFEVGATYYIRIYSKSHNAADAMGTFTICVTSITPTLSNDACNGAITLVVSLGGCTNSISATTVGAHPSFHSYNVNGDDDDVWFQFTATATAQKIIVEGSTLENPVVQVYSGACEDYLYQWDCFDKQSGPLEEGFINYLTIGNTYFVRVYSWALGTGQGDFSICLQVPALPVNDQCASATTLLPSPGLVCTNVLGGTTLGATQSSEGCNGTADDDVWYSFTATSSSHIIQLSDIISIVGESSPIIQAFSGSCDALVSLNCVHDNSLYMKNLTVGGLYHVRIYTDEESSRMDYNICVRTVPPPPVNDECTGAVSLTINSGDCSTSTTYTTAGATNSMISTMSCQYGADDDVWFSFVATDPVHIITLTDIPMVTQYDDNAMRMEAFSGTCGNLTTIKCGDHRKMVLTNLTPGDTYFVSVYTFSYRTYTSFRICMTSPLQPPLNDLCNGSILLIPSATAECLNAVMGTTVDAYQSTLPPCADGSALDDVWYKFTATSSVHGVSVYALSLTYAVIEIYKGNCGNPSLIFCSTDLPYSSYYGAKLDGLTLGDTYFIRIYSLSDLTAEEGIFSICVTTPYSLANDPCEAAIDLPVNLGIDCVQSTKGNNYDACASVFPSCIGYADDDVWYKFTALSDSHIIRVDSTTVFDLVVQLLKGTCNTLIPSKCIDNTTSGAEQATVSGLVPGSVYYLRIYSKKFAYWNRGEFRICITTPLPNDNCTTPTPLTVSPTCTNPLVQNSSTATPYALLPHCAGEPDDDLWFTFVATAPTQSIVINASPNDYTAIIEVFKGNCLGAFVGCKTNTPGDSIFTYTLNTLITGTKYYVRVFKKEIGGGAFSICVIGATSGTEYGGLSEGHINIYPNPVNDFLTIEVAENIEVKYITLLDMQTRVCIHRDTPDNTTQLDLSGLPSGIYIVQIQTAQGFYFNKVVKE